MVAFISTWFQFLAILFGSKLLLVFLHFSFVCLNLLNSKSENKKSVCTERERREREMIDFISTQFQFLICSNFFVKAFDCLLAFSFDYFCCQTQKQKSVSTETEEKRREREREREREKKRILVLVFGKFFGSKFLLVFVHSLLLTCVAKLKQRKSISRERDKRECV